MQQKWLSLPFHCTSAAHVVHTVHIAALRPQKTLNTGKRIKGRSSFSSGALQAVLESNIFTPPLSLLDGKQHMVYWRLWVLMWHSFWDVTSHPFMPQDLGVLQWRKEVGSWGTSQVLLHETPMLRPLEKSGTGWAMILLEFIFISEYSEDNFQNLDVQSLTERK